MKLKRFEKGQTAYMIDLFSTKLGKGKGEYRPVTVRTAGRQYVTIQNGMRYVEAERKGPDSPLESSVDYGWGKYLVPTEHEAKDFIEKHKLLSWFRRYYMTDKGNHLSLEQLRSVKNILEPDERHKLLFWFRRYFLKDRGDDLSLGQLRDIKNILKPEKQERNPDEYTLKVTVRTKFLDDESDAGTVRYCLEQDLEDAGWDCDVELAGRMKDDRTYE